jgi:hypothetical protein
MTQRAAKAITPNFVISTGAESSAVSYIWHKDTGAPYLARSLRQMWETADLSAQTINMQSP